ncbi:GNAT family N-acetyltransferase [Pseudoduganella sp. LjRoot289]|uniref:GNAT family N-acetyltransferase n=1 Tax=Pseudoduganella sp. LjRoot289 TaxID=3342314 RepID=UPI003ECFF942
MLIRKAMREDAVAISALINDLMPFMTLAPDGAGAEQFILSMSQGAVERYAIGAEYQYWTGWVDGDLAGVVALRNGTHLYHLFVARRFHGQGLARQLWRTARAAASGPAMTVNASLCALPVYEHFGFVATGARVEEHGIAYVPMRLAEPAAG